jgi:4-amino-4-deoxy-L-arabinose transferase-like glycosyltransferase
MSSTLTLRRPLSLARRWPLVVLAVLLPVWCVGALYRDSWTPDEPREADIVRHMQRQSDHALPDFAGTPFLEKPPLTYWIAAEANSLFGDSIRASRVPNIVYAAITMLAIGALAFTMAGAEAALLASLLTGSTFLILRVSIWLAPDACLMAGCTLALLGAYLGYTARRGLTKLGAYTLMHVAAAVAFMAKSAPGWIVPALALFTVIAWERRWSELRRPELYAGLLLQALIIVPWIMSVWRMPDGLHALRVLFLDNLGGRFTTMTSADGTTYSSGHPNWPGRYLVELPLSLMPWTFLVLGALRSAWTKYRSGTLSTPWRFAIASSVPFIVVLSVASTARDIYAAPAVPGLILLASLWALELDATHFALKATRTLVLFLGVVIAAATAYIARDLVFAALIALITVLFTMKARQLDPVVGLVTAAAGFSIALVLGSVATFPTIDRWQDLASIARAIHRDSDGKPLALLHPDETTVAMLDDSLGTPPLAIRAKNDRARDAVLDWFCTHPDGRLLVLLSSGAPRAGDAASLERSGVAKPLTRYALPYGRHYALMGPQSRACDHEALAVERP